MEWLRLYHSLRRCRKIQELPDKEFKIWVNMLIVASEQGARGVLPTVEDLAFELRVKRGPLVEIMESWVTNGLLDLKDGALVMHDWDDWQYEGEPVKERVRRYRDRREKAGLSRSSPSFSRKVIFSRDGDKCVYCGSSEKLCVDHAKPILLGGNDDEDNLVTACRKCNCGKAGRTPEQAGYVFIDSVAQQRVNRYLERCNGYSNTFPSVSVLSSESVSEICSEEKKDNEVLTPQLDETWQMLLNAADAIPLVRSTDSATLHRLWTNHDSGWCSLSMEQRKAAIDGLTGKRYPDAAYAPTLEKYIYQKKWLETIRPRSNGANGKPTAKENAKEIELARVRETLANL